MKINNRNIFLLFSVACFLFIITIFENSDVVDNQQHVNAKDLPYSDLGGSCPNATSIVVTVIPGGRFGNQVWEYLSVWAVAQNLPESWPAVPRQILDKLKPMFSLLAIPAIEDLAERCNAPFWIEELKNSSNKGNEDLLQAALDDTKRTRPFLLVLKKYLVDVNSTAPFWPELRLQLLISPKWQKASMRHLNGVGKKIRMNNEPLEYVGVHVRRTDYNSYIVSKFSDAKPAGKEYYLQAMEEMRRQLHPRHCVFVVVSDDLDWCNENLIGAPDVVIAGDAKNPYFDLALLSACNHTIFAYGTYGLTAAMQVPFGETISYSGAGSDNAITRFARKLNWTIV